MVGSWTDRLQPPVTDIIEVGGGERLAVAVWPGSGPTFVFAPGLTSNNRNIAGVAALLDGSLTVVSVDLRGRGDSTKPGPGHYGMATHAGDVIEVMDALGIERAVVGGHSMGAYVATAAHTAAPERCPALVMIDGGVLLQVPGLPDPDTLLELGLGAVMARLDMGFPSPGAYRDHLAGSSYFEMSPIAEVYMGHDLGVTRGGYQPKCVRRAAAEDWRDLLTNPDTVGRLKQISGPVLAVQAEEGIGRGQPPILPPAAVEQLRAAVEDVEVVAVPGTTHHSVTLSERGAAATAAALSRFVSRVWPTG